MVIMWPNSDGTITLSQRKASSEVEPKVDSSPPRVASLSSALSSVGVLEPLQVSLFNLSPALFLDEWYKT
jgi:hypothetical protein